MSKSKKRMILAAAVVVVAGGATLGFLTIGRRGPAGIEVETAPAARMRIVQTVSATGRIQPKTQVNISADVSAKITKLGVEEGDRVRKGDFLVELDRDRYVAAVESAEAQLRVAQSNARVAQENLSKAEKDYHRVRDLHAENLETQAALDAALAAYQAERARHQSMLDQVEQVRADLKRTQDDLAKTRIYAPIDGTISKLNKEVGEIALGSQFQEDVIMELSNLGGMEALVDVDENDIVRVARGDNATIEVDALPDHSLPGTVTDIANSAKISGTGTTDQKTEFEVKIAVDIPDAALRPGMTATADVVTDVHDAALGVPIQSVAVRTPAQLGVSASGSPEGPALVPDKDGFVQVVFVVQDGKARARQVKTGIQSDSHIEILEGLSEGDEIVTGNYRAISKDLADGSVVAVRKGASGGSGSGGASDDGSRARR